MHDGRNEMVEIPYEIYEQAERKWPKQSGVFQVGEKIKIKGAWFKVHKITLFGIMLKAVRSTPEKESCSYDHSAFQDKDACCPDCGSCFNRNF